MSAQRGCVHHPRCPGCGLIELSSDEQRLHKKTRLESALQRFGLDLTTIRAVESRAPEFGYRTRAKLMVDGAALGLFASGTHEVIDIPECRILSPVLACTAASIRGLLSKTRSEDRPQSHSLEQARLLRAVDLREVRDSSGASVLVTLALDAIPDPGWLDWFAKSLSESSASVRSVSVSVRDIPVQVLGKTNHHVRGPERVHDRFADEGPYFLATSGSFVQAHRGVAAAIHRHIEQALASSLEGEEVTPSAPAHRPRVVELHAGSGALALRLVAAGYRVLAVESYAPAIELAREAAVAQELDGFSARVGDAGEVLKTIRVPVDAVIVDPPRRGLTPDLRAALETLAPTSIVYVSCDPDTLARDLSDLARRGYRAQSITPYDMMPQTEHVETLVELVRADASAPTVIFEDERLIVVDKPPFVALDVGRDIEEPENAHGTLLSRVRKWAPEAQALHGLGFAASGLAFFARAPEWFPELRRVLAGGQLHWRGLVRGVTHRRGTIRRPLRTDGKRLNLTTRYEREAVVSGHSLVLASAGAGDSSAISQHFSMIGHPVLGDTRFGHPPSNRHMLERASLERPFVHCERARVEGWPEFESPLASDLALVLERLASGRVDDS